MEDVGGSGPWMNGDQANSQLAVGRQMFQVAATVFALVGSNRYVENSYFKPDEVVVEETARDNKALISAGAAILLLILVLIVLIR